MTAQASFYAGPLRQELGMRNREYARARAHVESYGDPPVIVYPPEDGRHGNFFDAAYTAILSRPEWLRRFDKIHAQGRSLPKPEPGLNGEPPRRWRELDSSMSSDALLMNVFCTPGVAESPLVRRELGIDSDSPPLFGWKARVPLANGRQDRTEVDMRWGSLLVEAKLTESDFQTRETTIVEGYRDFNSIFNKDLLPRVLLRTARRRSAVEFAEEFTQEWEPAADGNQEIAQAYHAEIVEQARELEPAVEAYSAYQLIRNVLAAHASQSSFCVILDARRPDLLEAWFAVMAAVKPAELRVRLKVLTWQELAEHLPNDLQEFLDLKYGIL